MKLLENKFFILILLLIVLCSLRLGIVLTSVESVSHYDEIDLGTIAREIILGPRVSFWFFQLDAYSGEGLILGPLVVPFFIFLGQNLFAIKMVPLLFSALTLCLIFAFLDRYFVRKAAVYGGLLFVFAAPGLVQLSLVNMTGHSEAFFFGFAALFCFYEFLFARRQSLYLFLFGIVSGFAVWFYYANAMLVVSSLIVLFLAERRLFFRSLPLFAFSFCLGFSPWLLCNLQNHFLGLELVSENIKGWDLQRLLYILKKPAKLFLMNIPASLATIPVYGVPALLFSYAYYVLLLVSVIPFLFFQIRSLVKQQPVDSKLLVWGIYPFVFFCVLMVSQFDPVRTIGFVGYRYVTPFLLVLLVAAAIRFASAPRGKIFFISLIFMGIVGQGSLLFKEPLGRALHYQGYSYYQLGTRWHFNLSHAFKSYEDFQRQTAAFSTQERWHILLGLSAMAIMNAQETLFEEREGTAPDLTVQSIARYEKSNFNSISYEWWGAQRYFEPSSHLKEFEETYREIPEEAKRYFCQGWLWSPEQAANFLDCPDCYPGKATCDINQLELAALFFGNLDAPEWNQRLQRISAFPAEEKKRAYRGLGRALFLLDLVLNPLSKTEMPLTVGEIPDAARPEFYWGIGWGIRERFREDKTRALDWIARLPTPAHPAAKLGLAAYDRWYGLTS